MDCSIITPNYNSLEFLPRCCASIEDQEHVEFEHIIVDGCSTDGSVEWINEQSRLVKIIEPDEGMYDAINKGVKKSTGKFISYLNSDEQYLPGTLQFVKEYFEKHPQVDIIFGSALIINPDGLLLSYRKSYPAKWFYILSSHLYNLSCAMFLRREIFDDGHCFDPKYKAIGDADFVVRVLREGYKSVHVKRYFSLFTLSNENLGASKLANEELREFLIDAPQWIRLMKIPLNILRLFEKFFHGAYWQRKIIQYWIFTQDTSKRKLFESRNLSFKWPGNKRRYDP